MTSTFIYAFLSVLLVSLMSLIGVITLALKQDTVKKYTFIFLSLATGALLGDAFIHLIPESFEGPLQEKAGVLVILGIIIFFIIEKFLHWHHHEDDTTEKHTHHAGKMILISDGLHNFIDGIIIGASFIVSIPVGIATTIAVILHEIPQEIGDFGVLIHSGYTKTKALFLNFVSASFALLGVVVSFLIGEKHEIFAIWLLPIAAGGFIYVAMADLIPELNKDKSLIKSITQIIIVLLGIFSMIALTLLEEGH